MTIVKHAANQRREMMFLCNFFYTETDILFKLINQEST